MGGGDTLVGFEKAIPMSQHTSSPRLNNTSVLLHPPALHPCSQLCTTHPTPTGFRIVVQGCAIQAAGGRRRESGDGIRDQAAGGRRRESGDGIRDQAAGSRRRGSGDGIRDQAAGGGRRGSGDGIRERRYTTDDACSPTRAARFQMDSASNARRSNPEPDPAARSRSPATTRKHRFDPIPIPSPAARRPRPGLQRRNIAPLRSNPEPRRPPPAARRPRPGLQRSRPRHINDHPRKRLLLTHKPARSLAQVIDNRLHAGDHEQ
jgi:hypothetical protein